MAVAFNFAPRGWAFCSGQLMPINQNQALFALLGTTYGGDGRTTFALPNLQARIPVGVGQGITLGQVGGEASVTLTTAQVPSHNHNLMATANSASATVPTGNVLAVAPAYQTAATSMGAMAPSAISPSGGSQPHENRQPFLVVNFVIALQGIFPSQN
jgi:microcystin-dependent protein